MKHSPSGHSCLSGLRFSQQWQHRGARETLSARQGSQGRVSFSQSSHRSSPHRQYRRHQFAPSPSGPVGRQGSFARYLAVSATLALTFVFVGFTTGRDVIRIARARFFKDLVTDSEVDNLVARALWERACKDPAYQQLISHPGLEPILPLALSTEQELEIQQAAAEGKPRKELHHFILNALRGSRGLIAQAFIGRDTKRVYLYVTFGHGTESFVAGTVSAGAIAAILQEAIRLWAKNYFPVDTSYRLRKIDLDFPDLQAPIGAPLVIGVLGGAESWGNRNSDGLQYPGQNKSDLPSDWFDHNDWETCVNSASTIMYIGSPIDQRIVAAARGFFEVEPSESWPPNAPGPPPSLTLDGTLT